MTDDKQTAPQFLDMMADAFMAAFPGAQFLFVVGTNQPGENGTMVSNMTADRARTLLLGVFMSAHEVAAPTRSRGV